MTILAAIMATIALTAIMAGALKIEGDGLPEDRRSGILFYGFATLAALILLVVFVSVFAGGVAESVSQLSHDLHELGL